MRVQMNEVITRYVINDGTLRATKESKRFTVTTGNPAQIVECRTTPSMGLHSFVSVTHAKTNSTLSLPTDQDWLEFQALAKQWRDQRGTSSSPVYMALCPAYQQIMAKGPKAVRLILTQLALEGDDPDHWFWALNYLTGTDAVAPDHRGNMKEMAADWIRWGRNHWNAW